MRSDRRFDGRGRFLDARATAQLVEREGIDRPILVTGPKREAGVASGQANGLSPSALDVEPVEHVVRQCCHPSRLGGQEERRGARCR